MLATSTFSFSVSPQQRRLWQLQEARGGEAFVTTARVRVAGPLAPARLQQAVDAVVARHDILRTIVERRAGRAAPVQVVLPDSRLALDHQDAVLRLALPSLCADRIGAINVMREIADHVHGRAAIEPPVQYTEYVELLSELMASEDSAAAREFWRAMRPSVWPRALLPLARAASASAGRAQESLDVPFDATLQARLEALAATKGESLEGLLCGSWEILIGRLAQQPACIIGLLADGRTFQELEPLPGLYAQYLPLRVDLVSSRTATEAVTDAARRCADLRRFQDCFQWELVAPPDETPSFDVTIEIDLGSDTVSDASDEPRFLLEDVRANLDAPPVGLRVVRRAGQLAAELRFDPAVYERARVQLLADQYPHVLRQMLDAPERAVGELDLLAPEERRRVFLAFNGTEQPLAWPPAAHDLVDVQAAYSPQACAVVDDGASLAYGELAYRSNQLAHHLRALGVGRDCPVAIYLPGSVDFVIAMLAVLKAGGAYVPVHPSYPAERVAFVLADCGARLVITRAALAPALPPGPQTVVCLDTDWPAIDAHPSTSPRSGARGDLLAYVIYTSGSTGRPKGVQISHESLVRSTQARTAVYRHRVASFLMLPPVSFDSSIAGLFWTLCTGGTLVFPADGRQADVGWLGELIATHRVSHVLCLPSLYQLLLDHVDRERLASLRTVIVAGEACPAALIRRHHAALPGVSLYNEYGPTECTVWCTVRELLASDDADPAPIGWPIAGMQAYLLDERGAPVPIGVAGELHIAGGGLARGYGRQPGATAAKFVPNPYAAVPGARMYRTGDLARHRLDGCLEFLGRTDAQVKIRGHRVEPAEIEAALHDHRAVQEAVVAVRPDPAGEPRLIAYVVPRPAARARVAGRPRRRLPNGLWVVEQQASETDYVYQEIFEQRGYLGADMRLANDACVVDIGANIGLFTLFAAREAPRARIYAFEPIPPLFGLLTANAGLYAPGARLFGIALSDRTGTQAFTHYPRYSLGSGATVYASAEQDAAVVRAFVGHETNGAADRLADVDTLLADWFEQERYECPVRRLSDVVRDEGIERIDLLKIDVQRAELDVLRGIDEEHWPRIGAVVLEVHDRPAPGVTGRVDEIRALLERHGLATEAEQEPALAGTDLFTIRARRAAAAGGAATDRTATDRTGGGRAAAASHDRTERGEFTDHRERAEPLTRESLREMLARRVPAFMMPAAFVLLDELPRLPNGKVDRAALPDPDSASQPARPAFVEPANDIERVIAEIWSDALHMPRVGRGDSFFDLGGHSLLAVTIHRRICEALPQHPLRLLDLFKYPTVEALAAFLVRDTGAAPAPADDDVQERAAARRRLLGRQQAGRPASPDTV